MRFISAILVTSVIASIGVQGLRPPEQPTRRSYGSSSLVPMSSEKDKPTETTTVPPIRTSVSTDTEFVWTSTPVTTNTDIIRTSTAAPSTATDVPQKDEGACEKFAFFHDWDVEYGDLPHGPIKGKYIYHCAEACLDNNECDATVSFEGACYPKSLDHAPVSAYVKKEGRDLAIRGSCEALNKKHGKDKSYPDGFLDCCYDKSICKDHK